MGQGWVGILIEAGQGHEGLWVPTEAQVVIHSSHTFMLFKHPLCNEFQLAPFVPLPYHSQRLSRTPVSASNIQTQISHLVTVSSHDILQVGFVSQYIAILYHIKAWRNCCLATPSAPDLLTPYLNNTFVLPFGQLFFLCIQIRICISTLDQDEMCVYWNC